MPFYDLIMMNAFEGDTLSDEENDKLKKVVRELVGLLQEAINIPNFWKDRPAEIRRLEGEVDDLLDFSKYPKFRRCMKD
ncbi:MAG: hypothetical protein U5L96_15975 [Owenweeksia sp.]|nr:hypothetical protein [Owenweeksia sp.]